ncbi:quinone oxidoreductase family protein [Ornithinibacillus xuwenensis]|uniref:Zinc-binding dehydrogenase n=1 Tax=Ornithinibacillus xuwenensis TaxID=3144668 RepID=A0ABU9XLM7_9BACI
MKKIVITRFGGPEVLKVIEEKIPLVKGNEVLIKVEKTSVNYADIKKRTGRKGKSSFPMELGLDAAGTIVEIGDSVKNLYIGQRVIAFPKYGSYAEFVVANDTLSFPLPDDISFETAAACPTVSFLSLKLLTDVARFQKDETILVHAAAGGVGTTAIQLAKLMGAKTIIGTVSHKSKFQTVIEAGASHVMLYNNFADNVNSITNGRGVNVILDAVAGKITEQSINCLAKFGRLVQFGNASGEIGFFNTEQLHTSCRSILGFSLGTTRNERPDLLADASLRIMDYLKENKLQIMVGAEFPLEEAYKAHELIESRRSIGKILLDVSKK